MEPIRNNLGKFGNQMNQKLEATIFGVLRRKETELYLYKIKPTGCQKDKVFMRLTPNSTFL